MKILVIYTGGISNSAKHTASDIEAKLKSYLELQLVATVEMNLLADIPGADVPYSLSTDLAKLIHNSYEAYDGFVVIHSIDNVLYTANLLAFQLHPLGKPVIFTGTTLAEDFFDFPGNFNEHEQVMYREMSLRTSLVTAVQLATENVAGVLLAYGPRIVRAVRALEHPGIDQFGFSSFQEEDVATVRFGIELLAVSQQRSTVEPQLISGVDPRVFVLPRTPQTQLPALADYSAALAFAYQDQLLPSDLTLPALPVFLLSSTPRKQLPEGTYGLPPLAPVAAICKLMVGCCHYKKPSELLTYMHKNIIGEVGKV